MMVAIRGIIIMITTIMMGLDQLSSGKWDSSSGSGSGSGEGKIDFICSSCHKQKQK